MCDCEKRGSNFLTGLALGALAGAGLIYFLTATKEGKKIKAQLEEKSDDVLDELHDLMKATAGAEVAISQIEKLRDRGRSAVKSFVRNGKPLTNS